MNFFFLFRKVKLLAYRNFVIFVSIKKISFVILPIKGKGVIFYLSLTN